MKVANKTLEKKLWPLAGTRELLVSLGFVGMFVDGESVLMCLDVDSGEERAQRPFTMAPRLSVRTAPRHTNSRPKPSPFFCHAVVPEAFGAALEFIEGRMPAPSSSSSPSPPPRASSASRSASSSAGAAEAVGISAEEVARRQAAMRAVEAERREQRRRPAAAH